MQSKKNKRRETELARIRRELKRQDGNVARAAFALGMPRSALYRAMDRAPSLKRLRQSETKAVTPKLLRRLKQALRRHHGNVCQVCDAVKINRAKLYRIFEQHPSLRRERDRARRG